MYRCITNGSTPQLHAIPLAGLATFHVTIAAHRPTQDVSAYKHRGHRVLYSTNIFDINNLDTLIYLSRIIRPQHRPTSTSLHASWDCPRLPSPSFMHRYTLNPPYDHRTWVLFEKLSPLKCLHCLICDCGCNRLEIIQLHLRVRELKRWVLKRRLQG